MNEILETFVKVLFLNKTINEAESLESSKNNRNGIYEEGINFRLKKAGAGNINLEVLFQDQRGMFHKPIGFYEFDSAGKVSDIFLLNEFVEIFNNIKSKLENTNKVKFLSLRDNIYIALGSREVGNIVMEMFNSPNYNKFSYLLDPSKKQFKSLTVNGLNIDIKTSMMGALEAIYDDENNYFNGEDILVMFQKEDGISIHSNEREYQNMLHKGLLSIF